MAKQKNKNKFVNGIIIYTAVLVFIIILSIILLQTSLIKFDSFRSHQDYIKNHPSPNIEDWMTPNTILRQFNISENVLFNELNTTKTIKILRTPLFKICRQQKINCTSLIIQLNNQVK